MTDEKLNEQIDALGNEMMSLHPRFNELQQRHWLHLASDQERGEYAALMARISNLAKQIEALLDQEELEQ